MDIFSILEPATAGGSGPSAGTARFAVGRQGRGLDAAQKWYQVATSVDLRNQQRWPVMGRRARGTILESDDGGANWSARGRGTDQVLYSIFSPLAADSYGRSATTARSWSRVMEAQPGARATAAPERILLDLRNQRWQTDMGRRFRGHDSGVGLRKILKRNHAEMRPSTLQRYAIPICPTGARWISAFRSLVVDRAL